MPRNTSETVHIEGLREFRAALKEAGTGWPKALGQANKQAAQIIADDASHRAESLGSTARHVASSIKAAATQQASVTLGGDQWPMALGAEFGSRRYPQFPPWRGNQWTDGEGPPGGEGYFLMPAVRENKEAFMEAYGRSVDELTRDAFPL